MLKSVILLPTGLLVKRILLFVAVAVSVEQRAGDGARVQRDRPGARHALPAAHHRAQQRGTRARALQLHHSLAHRRSVFL